MLLLVTDTSGKHGSVALVRATDPDTIETIEEVPLAGGTFSAQLVPQIAEVLKKHGLKKGDLAAFIVVSGPGSFTGLRVGLAAIKALAEILNKPIVPVSLLAGVAFNSHAEGKVLATLDAGRGEVYAAEYEVTRNSTRLITEQLLRKDELLKISGNLTLVTPDKIVAEFSNAAGRSVTMVDRPNAAAIGHLGWRKLKARETVTPEQLEANYIRRSDAEVFAKPATNP